MKTTMAFIALFIAAAGVAIAVAEVLARIIMAVFLILCR